VLVGYSQIPLQQRETTPGAAIALAFCDDSRGRRPTNGFLARLQTAAVMASERAIRIGQEPPVSRATPPRKDRSRRAIREYVQLLS
jgi:hypothetical protein